MNASSEIRDFLNVYGHISDATARSRQLEEAARHHRAIEARNAPEDITQLPEYQAAPFNECELPESTR